MAEGIVIGIAVSLLQQAIPAALSKLKTRFKQAKATEGEYRELEDFLHSVQDCAAKYQIRYGDTLTTTTTRSNFPKTLEDAQKTLEKWSSQNSRFFSRSSGDRVQKLEALHRRVNFAINVETYRMISSFTLRFRNVDGQIDTLQRPSPIHDNRERIVTTNTAEVSTDLVRSNSTGRASTNTSKPTLGKPTLGRLRSKSVERDRHNSTEKLRTEELWVRLDSEKQVRDMEKKLKRLQDVKRILSDTFTKKVIVMLGEESNIDTTTLLKEIQRALPKDKVLPTRWLDRPK